MIKRGDLILIIVIAVAVVLGIGIKTYYSRVNSDKDGIATIEVNGKVYNRYDLKKVGDKSFELELPDDQHLVVEFKSGMVRVREADCPDKVCVNTSWISTPGEIIVCLPYRVIIKVSGEKQDVDVNTF